MWLLLEPLDVLMLRDGRPFTAGENNTAQTVFPPSAFTVQGALRALYIEMAGVPWHAARHNADITAAVGTPDELGAFRMRGPYLARLDDGQYERVFPFPADLVKEKGRDGWRALRPAGQPMADSSDLEAPFRMLDIRANEEQPDKPLWLTEDALHDYLNSGYVSDKAATAQADLFEMEYRTGIALDYATRGVRDGQLYAAGFVRLQPGVALLVDLPDESPLTGLFADDQQHTIRFGGEGHAVRIRPLAADALRIRSGAISPGPQHKIVFLTMTYFAGSTQPMSLPAASGLVGLCAGKPLAVGGWNLAEQRPRAIYRYLPAGTVLYFENASQPVAAPLVDQPADCLPLAPLGFGEFVYGNWGSA